LQVFLHQPAEFRVRNLEVFDEGFLIRLHTMLTSSWQ
jgi:hypothetical protein